MRLNSLFLNPWMFFLVAIILTIGIILYLTLIEKVLKKKVVIKQRKEDNSLARRIKLIISSKEEPQYRLKKIDRLAREIFRLYFNLDPKLSYYELLEKFRKKGKRNLIKFCQEISELLYSGEYLEQKKLSELTKLLEKIEESAREEKKFTNLEGNVRKILIQKPKDNIFKRLFKVEEKFVTKLAKEKPTLQKPTKLPELPTTPVVQKKPQEIQYKSKIEKIKNLPLIKLFRFKKPEITITSKLSESQKQIYKQLSPIQINPETTKKKIIDQKIESLEKEIGQKQEGINKLKTKKQIYSIQQSSKGIDVEKTEKEIPTVWPPVRFKPKIFDEKREMPKNLSQIFKKTNEDIINLEKEIKEKQENIKKLKNRPVYQVKPLPKVVEYHIPTTRKNILGKFFDKIDTNAKDIDKEIKEKEKHMNELKIQPIQKMKPTIEPPKKIITSSPILKRFFEKIGKNNNKIKKEIGMKRTQIDLINLKKQVHEKNPKYNEPPVTRPKKYKLEEKPRNVKIKKEHLIHGFDDLERLKDKIRSQRANL